MKLRSLLFFLIVGAVNLLAQQDFVEVSAAAGINHAFVVDQATFGGGAAVLDYNNDGYEDLYVTGGFIPDVLYKNNGDGTFANVFSGAGFDRTLEYFTQGATAADVNRDGYKDLLITTMNELSERRNQAPNLLYLNNGDGTFTDVTKEWGLEAFVNNSTGATFGDINLDGYPDLYVSNYFSDAAAGISIYNEATITNSFFPGEDFLFLNTGGNGFIDASSIYGMDHDGFGFQGVFSDYDNDGDLDLYIANDFGFKKTPNLMYRNDYPVKRLKERSISLALNYGMNAMGIAACDYDFDGWMDYFVTNLSTSLFSRNEQNGAGFEDMTVAAGVGLPTINDSLYVGPPISWGANFFDYDHDTDMDLFVCNGALNPTIRLNPNLFFEFENGQFTEVAKSKNLADVRIGRGSVVFDYDNDGDMDLFVVNQAPLIPTNLGGTLPLARCLLYRNDAAKGNWLKVELQGVHTDLNGLGSRIEVVVDGRLLIREIEGGSSHLSQNTTIAHFGLGESDQVESVTVKWLGGKTQILENVEANQHIVIVEEGESTVSFDQDQLKVYPSVFTDYAILEYELDEAAPVELDVVNMQGQVVQSLMSNTNPSALGIMRWEVDPGLPTGTYIFRLRTPDRILAKKALKIR